VIIDNLMIW